MIAKLTFFMVLQILKVRASAFEILDSDDPIYFGQDQDSTNCVTTVTNIINNFSQRMFVAGTTTSEKFIDDT